MATLKERLIEKIQQVDDPKTLEEVYRLLTINFEEEIFLLSDDHKTAIYEAEEQIKNGQSLTSEEAHKQTEEWLKRRSSGQ
jgi:predicted Zn-ribbon and HTH transcriptional regulator